MDVPRALKLPGYGAQGNSSRLFALDLLANMLGGPEVLG
jgi:hypothetical protein